MPTSSLLMLYCLQQRKKAFYYATITVIASVVGGLFGYLVGAFLWDIIGAKLVSLFTKPETFTKLIETYKNSSIGAVFIASFLPIPYKMVTLTAGFCRLPLFSFFISISLARMIRFYLIAFTVYHWGERIQQILDDYFYYLIALSIALMVFFYLLIH